VNERSFVSLEQRWRRLLCSLLAVAGLAWGGAVSAASVDGYLSARFGMSVNETTAVMAQDGLVEVDREVVDGDTLLRAERPDGEESVDVLYVFPGAQDALALVIEFYPPAKDAGAVQAELTERYGEPVSEAMTASLRERMEASLPPGVEELTLWVARQEQHGHGRFVRLMTFPSHVAVEYLDSGLLAGAND
jgi:hypothetical protein